LNCINKKCGVELPDKAVYCLKCGRKQIREQHQKLRGNGQGSAYKRGETWTAEITLGYKKDKDGQRARIRRRKGGFRTKKDALDYIATLKREPGKKAPTLSNLYDAWSSSAMLKLSKSKQCAYRIASKKFEDIAYIDISALTIEDLQTCVDEHTESYYTAKDVKQLLSHLYERAVAQGNVRTNLAKFIELPELEEKETVPFSKNDQVRLWKDLSSGSLFPGYLLLMIHTGMMPGELLKAKKNMIDWDTQQIIGCGLKTKKRKETPILFPDIIVPVLIQLSDAVKDKLWPYKRDDFYAVFNDYIKLMGLNPELRPYSCRHSAATSLDEAGISPTIIQEIMRHTRFSTTERYIHKDMSELLKEINRKIKNPISPSLPTIEQNIQ